MTLRFQKFLVLASIAIPFIVYLLHANFFRNWIVDDAGISFVYARNLVSGYGLVSQPGVLPVEGYSNFLWVVLLAPFFALHWFDPILTPKILSAILVLATFFILAKTVEHLSDHAWVTSFVVLSLLSINTPFVVWTSSGLENPLYVMELALLFLLICRWIKNPDFSSAYALVIGLLCGMISLTHPEAVLYSAMIPLIIALVFYKKNFNWKIWVNRFVLACSSFLLIFGGYLVFRRLYFGDFYPNTYYAKGGPTLDSLKSIILLSPEFYNRLADLNYSLANKYGSILFAALLISWLVIIIRGRIKRQHLALLAFYAMSIFAFLLLPRDWMKEYRFATPVILFFYPGLILAGEYWLNSINIRKQIRFAIAGLAVVLFIAASVHIFYPRTLNFASNPTVPFSNVIQDLALPFNYASDRLEIQNGSLLIPDTGGTMYASRLRIYDLAGLCDKVIARTMTRDQAAFYDYLFEVAKPTFIHTHYPWDLLANLDGDPRFRNDYIPIREGLDPQANILSGDYVRKDVLLGKENLLPSLFSP